MSVLFSIINNGLNFIKFETSHQVKRYGALTVSLYHGVSKTVTQKTLMAINGIFFPITT